MKQTQDPQTVFDFMTQIADGKTGDDPVHSVASLAQSETGLRAITHLYRFLDGPGLHLDGRNRVNCLNLLHTAWGGQPGKVLRALVVHVNGPKSF